MALQNQMLPALEEVVRDRAAADTVDKTLRRVMRRLDAATGPMAWEVVPLDAFGPGLPPEHPFLLGFRHSCWRCHGCRAASEQPSSEAWGMLSFHTVAPEELIEETPVDAANLEGETHQEPYAGRR